MTHLGDIWLEHDVVDDTEIASAVRVAFGVDRVTVWPMFAVTDLDADVIVQREHQEGDFRGNLSFSGMPATEFAALTDDQVLDAVRVVARELGQSLVTAISMQYPGDFLLIMPSGDTMPVEIDDDAAAEGRLELTPESRHRWKAAVAHVAAAD